MLPRTDAEVFFTPNGTPYLKDPGVVMIARPQADLSGAHAFLNGFASELAFPQYLVDTRSLPDAETLCKFAGQLCYLSFGPVRTWNNDAESYFRNIKESGHGSVLEHANFSFLFYGISRSLTHELVRHRAGFAFSQVSQRYVGGKTLRFVQRPEFERDAYLREMFSARIDRVAEQYEVLTGHLADLQASAAAGILTAGQKTELRKKVRQAARACLTNETEAPILVTANVRAWRHFIEMRASLHAEVEIRRLAVRVLDLLYAESPLLFGDYVTDVTGDGTRIAATPFRKV